jgi:hypothetical protein
LGDELGASVRSNSREAWASWFPVRNLYPFSWCLYGPVSRFGFTAENAENAENPGNRTAFFFFFFVFLNQVLCASLGVLGVLGGKTNRTPLEFRQAAKTKATLD